MFAVRLFARLTGSNRDSRLHKDGDSRGLVIINHPHYLAHQRQTFEWSDNWLNHGSGNRDYLFTCITYEFHLFITRLIHNNDLILSVYKSPTVSANGIEVSGYNKSWHTNAPAPTSKLYVGPTVTDPGTLVNAERSFSNNNASSQMGDSDTDERILYPGQSALIRITQVAGNVDGSIRLTGYNVVDEDE